MEPLSKLTPEVEIESLSISQNLTYNWAYDTPRKKLTRLYENAKRDQWNGSEQLDWSIDVDPEKGLIPDMAIAIYGTPIWDFAGQEADRAPSPRSLDVAAVPVPARRTGSVASHLADRHRASPGSRASSTRRRR